MLVSATDEARLVDLSIHVGAALTEGEIQSIVSLIGRQAAALEADPRAEAISFVIVETENGPDARVRRRIGEASRKVTRGCHVLVTQSALIRMVVTAIRWFSPPTGQHAQMTFGTYDEACAWLVQRTGHPREVFDSLHARARAEIRRRGGEERSATTRS